MNGAEKRFPEGFLWGAATAAFQVEGAHDAGGKGPSIWDDFCRKKGRISDGSDGKIACRHFEKYADDVRMMQDLGLNAYRFSVSWPRIQPVGKGRPNAEGLSFYDRLTDSLLEAGITPFLTLYHWDLPSALQEEGGWENRNTAELFAEYARIVIRALGDRIRFWTTMNEPLVFWMLGHFLGWHAPGRKGFGHAARSLPNILLGHGLAASALKAFSPSVKVGLVNALRWDDPVGPRDAEATELRRDLCSRMFLDPVLKKTVPEKAAALIRAKGKLFTERDLDLISAPIDFLGVNHYDRALIKRSLNPLIPFREIKNKDPEARFTSMGWEVCPEAFGKLLAWLRSEYPGIPLYITENGSAYPDRLEEDAVHDPERTEYLKSYLNVLWEAVSHGTDVRGYFVWSLMDNFEWAYGYSRRFGIVYVDFAAQKRVLKDSGRWYSEVCRSKALR